MRKRPPLKADKIPRGWYSREHLQRVWDLAETQTKKLIKQEVDAGAARVKMFRIKRPTGIYRIPFYNFDN